MKKMYEVVIIDSNNCAINEIYTASDIIILFAILAKEMANKDLEYKIKKIVITEELK